MSRFVYADNSGTTPMSEKAFQAMKPFFCEKFGNASSHYSIGYEAKDALDEARAKVAKAIGAEPAEIYFTGGGSEADNWALKGVAELKGHGHIITTNIEHHAMTNTCAWLRKKGFDITEIHVDNTGLVPLEALEAAIREDTILVTMMMANNEVGTIQPMAEIGEICHKHGVLFHTDAVQATGHVPIDVKAMNIDLLSMAGHKFRGPKGVGALYCRKGLRLPALIHGGGQEKGRRGGTENVAGYVGMGVALEDAVEHMEETSQRLMKMRDRLISGILEAVPYSRLTGHPTQRLPGHASFIFESVEGESILLHLDMKGVCASTGSACNSDSLEPSHVLLGIGLPAELAHGSLRLSLGEINTEEDVDYLLEVVPPIIAKLREMSPLWDNGPTESFDFNK